MRTHEQFELALFTYEELTRKLTLRFKCEIDHCTCTLINILMDSRIKKYAPETLVFDFSDVTFMDSSVSTILIRGYKQLALSNGQTEIINVSAELRRTLSFFGIFQIIPEN